jgi:hypothetical protein
MMIGYKFTTGGVLKLDNGAVVISIPDDPGNRDWQEFETWLLLGNTPEPADIAWPEPTTPALVKRAELAAKRPALVADAILIEDSIILEEW